MNPRPRAVVFDLGKVLLDFDYGIAAQAMAAHARLDAAAIRRLIDQSPLLHRYETGHLDTAQLFEEVVRVTGFAAGLDTFRAAFADIFSEIPPMVALHADLRAAGIPTHILSNTNDVAVHHIRARFPFFATFDSYIFSHEVRSMKPAPPIYDALEASAGFKGPDLLYIDDRAENIEAAQARGWRCILHHDPAATVREVRNLVLDR